MRSFAVFLIETGCSRHLHLVRDRGLVGWSSPLFRSANGSSEAVAASRKAETDARFRVALHQHTDVVWRVLRRAGLAPANAEDATQDVFWIFAQRLAEVPPRAERSFLVSTALNVAADRKRLRWHRSVVDPVELETCHAGSLLPDEAVDLARARALLDQTLDELSAPDRSVFILVELEGMTRAEVAGALDIPEGTVASRLRRARQTFASALRRFRSSVRNRV